MNKSTLKDLMMKGGVIFSYNTPVVLIRKKQNGYPRFLEFGKQYIIQKIEAENIYLLDTVTKELRRVHYSYVAPVYLTRDEFINSLLEP